MPQRAGAVSCAMPGSNGRLRNTARTTDRAHTLNSRMAQLYAVSWRRGCKTTVRRKAARFPIVKAASDAKSNDRRPAMSISMTASTPPVHGRVAGRPGRHGTSRPRRVFTKSRPSVDDFGEGLRVLCFGSARQTDQDLLCRAVDSGFPQLGGGHVLRSLQSIHELLGKIATDRKIVGELPRL